MVTREISSTEGGAVREHRIVGGGVREHRTVGGAELKERCTTNIWVSC